MAVTARADSSAEAASGASASTTSSDGRNRWEARPSARTAAAAASHARDSTPIRRPAITSSPSPASLASAASRAGVACAVKISRSTGSVSAGDSGGLACSSASLSRSAVRSSASGMMMVVPGTVVVPRSRPIMITRAPQASCSPAWSADAVTNTACSRYSAGRRCQGTDPVTRTDPGPVSAATASSRVRTAGAWRGSRGPA